MAERNSIGSNGRRAAVKWEKPLVRQVGSVGDVFQMPGEGKLSMVSDDMGDAPRKPKGQEGS